MRPDIRIVSAGLGDGVLQRVVPDIFNVGIEIPLAADNVVVKRRLPLKMHTPEAWIIIHASGGRVDPIVDKDINVTAHIPFEGMHDG